MKFNMSIFFTAIFVGIFTLLAGDQVKEMILESGSRVILEPDNHQDFVTLIFFADKMMDTPAINFRISTELYLEALKNELNTITDFIYSPPRRLMPESFYNWNEHQYFLLNLTRKQFEQSVGKIASIFQKVPDLKKLSVHSTLLDYSEAFTDSVLYTQNERHVLNEIVRQLTAIKNAQPADLVGPEIVGRSIQAYFYGNFDPLEIIKLLKPADPAEDNKEPQPHYRKVEGLSTLINSETFSYVRISLQGQNPELPVIVLFVTDYLKKKVSEFKCYNTIRFYHPLQKENQSLIVYLDHPETEPDAESLISLITEIKNTTPEEFTNWYYKTYTRYLEQNKSDAECYILNQLYSKMYYNNFDTFNMIDLNTSEAYELLKETISEFEIESND